MKRVLLVDDEMIIRMTLRSLIHWEELGYELVHDAINGEAALAYLSKEEVDLLITDMKMPVMDGIELLRRLKDRGYAGKSIILSGYNDFHLVREGFRMGASDYLLKSDLNAETLLDLLGRLYQADAAEPNPAAAVNKHAIPSKGDQLAAMALGRMETEPSFLRGSYGIVRFQIDDYEKQAARFGDQIEETLTKPFLECANQIPRAVAHGTFAVLSPSSYLLYYETGEGMDYKEKIHALCRQLISVWNNYMNLPVSAGVSEEAHCAADFYDALQTAGEQLILRFLVGRASIHMPWEVGRIRSHEAVKACEDYKKLLEALYQKEEYTLNQAKAELFAGLYQMPLAGAKKECLLVIEALAVKFQDNHDSIWSLFQEDVNYYEKIERIDSIRTLEIWMNNLMRQVMDYIAYNYDLKQADIILRAKRFIMDHYYNPELSVGHVARYVGLNEKYFSTRFNKECNLSFSAYLNEIRISKARELMDRTDLKIYEISEQAGYHNVEHFTRVFKKLVKVSPTAYKKSGFELEGPPGGTEDV